MPTYNKLVRDRIPEIINNRGASCNTRILDETEYMAELRTKGYSLWVHLIYPNRRFEWVSSGIWQ
ncbi:hypothetical protein PAECIP111802_07027 [Paenibacillus allorhizosphaerae]|uniref:Uncharacterized protein n=1 Tax=Paenibacillus allorhizosphaerae TaxID=2849866 RepID=A0ABN7U016_9BACL|nr:hypothetical protein PAECIP111802_07027 [Paenibacillus allorhizosphaerae]